MDRPQRFLYPQRKRAEVMMAIFSGGFGAHITASSATSTPLWWVGFDQSHSAAFGLAMLGAALLWAIGININGRWRYSPALRLIAMAVSLILFATLMWAGLGGTAGYVYGWITAFLIYATRSAFVDTKRSLEGGHGSRAY